MSKLQASPDQQKNLASALSVARQFINTRAKRSRTTNLIGTRCERNLHPLEGAPTLYVLFPKAGGGQPQRIDLSFLLGFPNLEALFSESFRINFAALDHKTRIEYAGVLKRGLFRYLHARNLEEAAPEDLNAELFDDFLLYLRTETKSDGKQLSTQTTRLRLTVIRSVLAGLQDGPHAKTASLVAEKIPQYIAAGEDENTPTEILSLSAALSIMSVAEKEIIRLEEKFQTSAALVERGREMASKYSPNLQPKLKDFSRLELVLAYLDKYFKGVIPNGLAIAKKSKALEVAINRIHGQNNVVAHFQPSPRAMVPFALLIDIATVFSPDTVLSICSSNVQNADLMNQKAIKITAPKGRATEDPTLVFDPEAGVAGTLSFERMLRILKNITERIRPSTISEHKDNLFIFVPEGRNDARSFGSLSASYGPSHDGIWQVALRKFISENGLPAFTLGQIRPTILNLIQESGKGVDAAQHAARHRNVSTTWTHYTSDGIRKKYREQVGAITMVHERWFKSNGIIDPRLVLPQGEIAAATPGFGCVDPLDSPKPNQRKHILCSDYGGCPDCPLAVAWPNDPNRVVFYIALEQAISKSQGSMPAATWLTRWVPVLSALKALLKIVPKAVYAEASIPSIILPRVG